jgi:hypothetical protein
MHEFLLSIADIVGIIGVIIILVAYFLLSTDRMVANSFTYHIINFIGAWMILFSLYFHWNLSSVIIEVAWIAISLIGLYRVVRVRESD